MRLRIKYCKVDLLDEVNASGRSALTKRRIQQALSRALAKYTFSEGSVKLKHVKLILGPIGNDHFEFEFYAKLEQACETFARKLAQEQQTEAWIRETRERKSISGATDQEIDKDQFDRLLRVIEGFDEFPNREQLIRAYFSLYLEEMPKVLQDALVELLRDAHESTPEIAKAQGSSELFESLDYLLDLLSNADPDSNWLERVKEQYEKRYGENMPEHLAQTLMQAIADEANAASVSLPQLQQESSDEIEQEDALTPSNSKASEVKKAHNTYNFILQWLEENAPLGNWLNRLQRNYRAAFDEEISQEVSDVLNGFNAEHTFTLDEDVATLALRDRIEKELGNSAGISKDRDAQEVSLSPEIRALSAVSKKDFETTNNSNPELETGVAFCNQWLSNKVLTGNWVIELNTALRAQFGQNLTRELANALMKNNALEQLDPNQGVKKELVAKIVVASTVQNNKSAGDQKEMKHLSFLIAWITSKELVGNWVAAVRTAFKAEFGTELPRQLAEILESFESESDERAAADVNEVLENLLEEALRSEEPIETKPTSEAAKHLSFLIAWITSKELVGNWIAVLRTEFKTEFGTILPRQLAAILESFESESDGQAADVNEVLENLLEEALRSEESIETKPTSEFAKHLSFLIAWITSKELSGDWIAVLRTEFKTEFGTELPRQLAEILESFESESDERAADSNAVLENLLEEALQIQKPKETKPTSEAAKHLSFLIAWITTNELIGDWVAAVRTAFKAEFGTELPRQLAEILESFESESDERAADSNAVLENLFEEALQTEEPEQAKSTSEAAKHLSFLIAWITSKELSGDWIAVLRTEFKTEFGTILPRQLAAILESFESESDGQATDANEVLENLFEEALQTEEPEQAKSTSEAAKHLSFLIAWITNKELVGDWVAAVKTAFKAEFGTELPRQLAEILESFAAESESEGPAADVNEVLENLLEEALRSEEPIETKPTSEFAKHLSFLIAWITSKELSGDWIAVLRTEFKTEFGTELPRQLAEILESFESESDERAADSNAVLENLLEEALQIQKPKETKPTSEAAKHLSFLIAWITTNELIGDWVAAVRTAFKAEFGTELPRQLAEILESFAAESESDGQVADPNEVLENLLEESLQAAEPKETKPTSEAAKHLSFLIAWITTNELIGDWVAAVRTAFKAEFGTELPRQLAEILESFESESDERAADSNAVLENLLEEALQTEEPEQAKSTSEAAKHLSFLIAWITSKELSGDWIAALKTEFKAEFGAELPRQLAEILESFAAESESDERAADVNEVLENLLEEALQIEKPKETKPTSETAKYLSFLSSWITTHELIGEWLAAVKTDFHSEFGTELPRQLAAILESFESESDGQATDANEVLENLFEEALQTEEPEQAKSTSEAAKHLSFLIAWITNKELVGDWVVAVKTAFKAEFGTELPRQLAAILESFESESDGQATDANEVLENLFEEALRSEEPIETKPTSEFAKHLSFLIAWIMSKELSGDWIAVLRTEFKTEFGTELPRQLAEILESFESESDGQATDANAVLDNLLEEALQTEEPEQAKSTSEAAKHLSFLIAWITNKELVGDWVAAVKTAFKAEFGTELPRQLAEILESFESESDGQATDANEVLENLFEEALRSEEPIETKPTSEFAKHLSFLIAWITNKELVGDWVAAVKTAFKAEFGTELPRQLAAILESFESESDGQATDANEVLENLLEDVLQTAEPEQTKPISEAAKHLSFLIAWITSKELVGDWIAAVKTDFRTEFGSELPAYILAVLAEFQGHDVFKTKEQQSAALIAGLSEYLRERVDEQAELSSSSMDQFNDSLYESSFFLDAIKARFPKTVRQPFKEWADWISSIPAALSWLQCLQHIEQMHREIHGQELSLSKQLKFLELIVTSRNEAIFELQEDVSFHSRIREFFTIKAQSSDTPSGIFPKLDEVLEVLYSTSFDSNWFDAVKKNYQVKFAHRMPLDLQVFLFETRKAILLKVQHREVRIDQVKTVRAAVLERFSAPRFDDLQSILEQLEFSEDWLLVIARMFESSQKKELPLQVLQQLFQFSTEQPEWELADAYDQRRSLIEETIRKHFDRNRKGSGERSRQAFLDFLAEELDQLPPDKNWKKVLSERYTAKMGRAFPLVFNRLLDELHDAISGNNGSENPINKSLDQLRKEFDAFAKERSMNDSLRELIYLFRSLNQQHDDGWFSAVLSAYSSKFGKSAPIEVQKILLDFAAVQTQRSQQAESTEVKHYLLLLSAQVHTELESSAALQQERDEVYMCELIDLVDEQLTLNPSLHSLKEAYQGTFKDDLPSWVKALLLDYSPRYAPQKKIGNDIFARREVQSVQVNPVVKQTNRTSSVSNRAKILKLTKQLEAMKNKKEMKTEIIFDAGIPLGWIFWKKCFDRFAWLQEGRFYEKDGFNTALLAANWLTRLGTQAYGQELHPLMTRICDLSADNASYLDDDVLEKSMNGEKLQESIGNYYQEMMDIWQIEKVEELVELLHLFICREGVLTQTAAGWDLAIVESHFDLFIRNSPIPWPITFIRFPWTSQTFNIQWK